MSTHSRLSPSSRHRWSVCPGSVREEAKYPDVSGHAAIDGTHSHTLLEKCIVEDVDPYKLVGCKLSDDDGTFEVDVERAERVRVATEYVAARRSSGKVHAERQVDPKPLVRRDDMSGTLDIMIDGYDELEIIDYKDGMNKVNVVNNLQLEQYAIAALVSTLPMWETVKITIIQPKLRLTGGEPISSHVVSVKKLFSRIPVLIAEAKATDDPDAPLVAGPHCKYCKHGGACSTRLETSFKKVDISPATIVDDSMGKNPSTMTDEQLVRVMEAAPMIRGFLLDAEGEAFKRLNEGKHINGLKLVCGKGSRSWAIPLEDVEKKLKLMGVPKSAIYKSQVVSVAQAEKLAWESKGEMKTLSDKQRKVLQEYVRVSKGNLKVALSSEAGEEVVEDYFKFFKKV